MMQTSSATPSNAFFIWRLITYQPVGYVITSLTWIAFHSWPLLPGLVAKIFFDSLESRASVGLNLPTLVALVVAVGLLRAVIIFSTLYGRRWAFAIGGLLQRNLFARVLERPGTRAVPGSVGEAISTLRDDVDLMKLMLDWVFDAIAGLVFAIGGITILLLVDARVTLLVFAPIVAVIVIAHVARTRYERFRAASREATAQVTGSIGEIFGAVQSIQVAGAEDRVVAHLRQLGDARQHSVLRDRLLNLSLDAVFSNTASLGAGLTLLVAAGELRAGTFSVGDFALFATYLMQVSDYTGFLGYLIATYRQARVSFSRGLTLLQGAPPAALVAHHPLPLSGALPAIPQPVRTAHDRLQLLEVRDLTLRYAESGRGIEEISFDLPRGSFTVVTGRIGSGKTTLLRALLGLLDGQTGEVRWNGERVQDLARWFVPPHVAYTPQVPSLLSGTLRDNLLLGLEVDDAQLIRSIRSAAFDRDVADFADGLETRIGVRGMRLSGGQVQRAAAARMLLRRPELLVCDDLSSALDVETERTLWERMQDEEKVRNGETVQPSALTILAVSHRRALLERADQILVLEEGRLTGCGKLKELIKTNEELQRIYALPT